MTKFLQIVFLIVAGLWFEVNGRPLFQGISFQRGFEINFKPLPRNPITFIKEKWSPFGVFGRKHSLQKRNSGSAVGPVGETAPIVPLFSRVPEPRPAAPVFEHVEETEPLRTTPLITLPHQTPRSVIPLLISSPLPQVSPIKPQLVSPGPPIISSPAPPPIPLSVIVTPVPRPVFSNVPQPSITPEVVNIPPNRPKINDVLLQPQPVRMEGGLPPLSTNMVIPASPGRFTDVSRAEPVREYIMNSIQSNPSTLAVEGKGSPQLETNIIKPEPPKNDIVINDNSLVRGSKIALYFGSIFLQLMSQFMSNARASFDQMTNPKPIYNN